MKNILNKITFDNYYYFRVIIPIIYLVHLYPFLMLMFHLGDIFGKGTYISVDDNTSGIQYNLSFKHLPTVKNLYVTIVSLILWTLYFII